MNLTQLSCLHILTPPSPPRDRDGTMLVPHIADIVLRACQRAAFRPRALLGSLMYGDGLVAEPSRVRSTGLVVSHWGLGEGYSGPLTLLDRLFADAGESDLRIDVVYRNTGLPLRKNHFHRTISILSARSMTTVWHRLRWGLALTCFLIRYHRRYDWIHFHGFYPTAAALPALAALPRDKPFTFLPVVEGGDLARIMEADRGLIRYLVVHSLTRRSRCIGLALSPGIADELAAIGVPSERVRIIPNPVDPEIFKPADAPIVGQTLRVGFVGKLGKQKHPIAIVWALRQLQDRGLDAIATFVGPFETPTYEKHFRAEAARAGVQDRVRLLGYVEDVSKILPGFDVFVLPSRSEGMPGSLVEALACGVPAVVTEVGGMGELIRESGAGLITTGDPADICRLLATLDRPKLDVMAAAAREFVVNRYTNAVAFGVFRQALDDIVIFPSHESMGPS